VRRLHLIGWCLGFLVLAQAAAAWAQAPVATADLDRLRESVADVERQAETLKATDAVLAGDVLKQLADLADEVVYLRVKLRRDGAVTRTEYGSLRDRIAELGVRAMGQKVAAQPVAGDPADGVRVPAGTEIDVRLQEPLSSATAKVEQRFEAVVFTDVGIGGRVAIPAGSVVRGFVSSVRAAGRLERRGSLTLSFEELRVGTRTYRFRGSVTQAIDRKMTEDTARIGAGAVVGAIVGGLLGGGKGALMGVLVGGGGTMAATDGADVELPAGTILRVRLDQPVDVFRE
jgi:hypothetical protein